MKLYPWIWQHIYLLSRASTLIWEKLYSETSGERKKGKIKETFPGCVWLQRRLENVTQESINTSQLITGG